METTPEPPPPPEQQQPEPKRQKMSTTTTSDEENAANFPLKKPRYKRRKVAIFLAYCGVGYQGMQKNPGAKTIEGDLEEALFFAGAIPEDERGQHRKFDFARSARTDKGVSAVGQVISGKFFVDPPGFVERLNSHLSPQIRIFGYKRTTPSFSSKKFCDRRRYVYLVPVFALDPSIHRNRESVMASLGSGEELVKCFECSERGRKVFGVIGNSKTVARNGGVEKVDSAILSNSVVALGDKMLVDASDSANVDGDAEDSIVLENVAGNEEKLEKFELETVTSLDVKSKENGGVEKVEDNSILSNSVVALGEKMLVDSSESKLVDGNAAGNVGEVEETRGESEEANGIAKSGSERFCYGDKERERFNRVLKYYEGTHNFHNFTTRTKAEDPAAFRYILSFNADTVINLDGIDFIKCEVVGQSFMLHQIRKMIGLAIAIMRNYTPESLIETAFEPKVRITVPMAPEVGLYLDECFFSSYNKKWDGSHEELSMKAYAEEAEEFKIKNIYSHVATAEHKEGAMALWLHSLNYRNYPDLQYPNNVLEPADNIQNTGDNCTSSEVKHDDIVSKVENSADNCTITEVKHDDVVKSAQNTADNCTITEVKHVDVVKMVENSADKRTITEVKHDDDGNTVENSADKSTITEVKHDETVNMVE